MNELTASGGLLIVGLGSNILGSARIPAANKLPALVTAPVLVMLTAVK